MARKYRVAIMNEVLKWVAEGRSVEELHQSDPKKYPTADYIASFVVENDEWRKKYHRAKWKSIYKAQDELIYLKDNPPKPEDYEDVRVLGQLTTQWKQKISVLEKHIHKYAGIYDEKLTDKPRKAEVKVEGSVGNSGPTIVIMDYKAGEAGNQASSFIQEGQDTYISPVPDQIEQDN